jgi:hypothetical protein
MNKGLTIKVIGAIVAALIAAVGYSLDIAQITNLDFKWLPIIAFIVFVGLVTWIFFEISGQVRTLLETKPSITVEPIKQGDRLFLRVNNNGAEGIFKAQIELISDSDPSVLRLGCYQGIWKFGNKDESKILKGHEDLVNVAELYSSKIHEAISQHFKFWFFDKSTNSSNYLSSSSHFLGSTVTRKDGSTHPIEKHLYSLVVTISSSPELKDGYFQKQYTLDADGWR